jgi:hypothetical protein
MKEKKKIAKKKLKTMSDEEFEYVVRWHCPYCKKENEDYTDGYIDTDEIPCSFCKKITKIVEPK